ncbi:MAG: DEAD/DEAH box helicase family protein [Selenomonadaceae bacterium]|nr:DEAD/DEAH box helicase family protein [Selenomonadaceae bacterium]
MKIKINTAKKVTPTIYAYTTPDVANNFGWTKIGYTERDVKTRINEQLGTARIAFNLEWTGEAIFDSEPRKIFIDKDFHAYLQKLGIEKDKEWFKVTGETSRKYFYDFKENRGVLKNFPAMPYNLREEQNLAVRATLKYFREQTDTEFLWNAKPRFGKTLAVYDLCKRADVTNVLIVTNRPVIANSWYDDYVKFLGGDEWLFVSEVDALKGKPYVLSRADFLDVLLNRDDAKCIEFVSLQDLKGSKFFGGQLDKLSEVADMTWDILVVDEAHEGVDTLKTDIAFDRINRRFTLHLSGTPFKALANNKFPQAAIFNWTYTDEQEKKISWDKDDEKNPYAELPRLNLYTYQMSEIVRDELKRGIEIDGASAEYAFDLNEFFRTDNGKFVYNSSVDKFLDALTTQKKFPFSTPELRDELRHTFWLLNRVESARLLAAKLQAHPIFRDYEIILAAGDGKIDDDDEIKKSYDKVVEAIKNHERTITLSVGQLTAGVTIPEWTGVLMLANVHSPALYIQAAFRAQNPCLFQRGKNFLRKENSYVFDFDPARTLTIFEQFANDLASDTGGGRGDSETRKKNILQLLNFFPVIGEDSQGELIELDAEKVLSIPRKIRSVEVVRRGFMSDFLFQNIAHVFNASAEVVEIISKLPAVKEVNLQVEVQNAADNLSLDDDGEISLTKDFVIGKSKELFGEKIYTDVEPTARAAKKFLKEEIKTTLDIAQKNYGKDFKKSERDKLERQLKESAETLVDKAFKNHDIDKKIIEDKRSKALENPGERSPEEINAEFDRRQLEVEKNFQAELPTKINDFMQSAEENTVEHVETKIQEREKNSVEDDIRDHLRGFARTIPSFLMAYGDIDNPVTLATFDKIIPDEVFKELTSISLDQFRYLRDVGKLFDEVTFNDAVKEFLRLRRELADYFDENQTEDIFDYIPPQKTNQIFTPKETVQKMLALIEKDNPGCFDDPDKTFFDLYIKSGMFAAEIVKRLYRSPQIKKIFPDKADRLRHIFAKQIFGLAPTEIIFRIAVNYILGFGIKIDKHNFKQVDALNAVKDDNLNELLGELYD